MTAKVMGMKPGTCVIQGSYQNLSKIQGCHTTQKFHKFSGKTPINRDPLLLPMADFQKMGRFQMI